MCDVTLRLPPHTQRNCDRKPWPGFPVSNRSRGRCPERKPPARVDLDRTAEASEKCGELSPTPWGVSAIHLKPKAIFFFFCKYILIDTWYHHRIDPGLQIRPSVMSGQNPILFEGQGLCWGWGAGRPVTDTPATRLGGCMCNTLFHGEGHYCRKLCFHYSLFPA